MITIPTRAAIVKLAKSLVVVAAVGGVTAVAAYCTDHQAESPALFAALLFACHEALVALRQK